MREPKIHKEICEGRIYTGKRQYIGLAHWR